MTSELKKRASVIGNDLATFYALVEKTGLDEVRDLFAPAEIGALLCASEDIKLDELNAARMSWVFHGELERHGRLQY